MGAFCGTSFSVEVSLGSVYFCGTSLNPSAMRSPAVHRQTRSLPLHEISSITPWAKPPSLLHTTAPTPTPNNSSTTPPPSTDHDTLLIPVSTPRTHCISNVDRLARGQPIREFYLYKVFTSIFGKPTISNVAEAMLIPASSNAVIMSRLIRSLTVRTPCERVRKRTESCSQLSVKVQ